MAQEGWIKLHRQILESSVFAHQTALKIWIWCLCKASHQDKTFPLSTGKGETIVTIKKGQFIFGRFKAEEELGISGSSIYRWMHKFSDEMNMIKLESNTHYTIVTILNFSQFQEQDEAKRTTNGQPMDNQRTTNGQPTDTYKNVKNVKNEGESPLDDSIFMDTLKKMYPNLDYSKLWESCKNYHNLSASPPEHLWQWKQKLQTWVEIEYNKTKEKKKQEKKEMTEAQQIINNAKWYFKALPLNEWEEKYKVYFDMPGFLKHFPEYERK